MKSERYELESGSSLLTFDFVSEGPKGRIKKRVQYTETQVPSYYNLGFGDVNSQNEIDDTITTNNNDMEKVLTTVASTVYAFTNEYPDAFIYAQGNNRVRTRLYRRGISKYIDEISFDFDVYGLRNGEFENFERGIDYNAFLVKRKKKQNTL